LDYSHIPQHLNAVILSIGPVEVRWYGLMYLVAFSVVYYLALYRIKTEKFAYTKELIADFMFWAIVGILVGGRLGYVLFYNLPVFLSDPFSVVLPFTISDGFQYTGISGMSYHGGAIGLLLASLLFCRKKKINFWQLVDFFCPIIPLGYTFGRLGNFINGELWGRVTSMPWGMYFPLDSTNQLRHPSQLYEAFFEGVVLFVILWNLRKKSRFDGFLLSIYLIGYGAIRFFIEFFREPDPQLGFIVGPFTMGQVLCFVMILGGLFVFFQRKQKGNIWRHN
jgi:phosphatidylglycerol:prolipoprotein diacylglycerol transferase